MPPSALPRVRAAPVPLPQRQQAGPTDAVGNREHEEDRWEPAEHGEGKSEDVRADADEWPDLFEPVRTAEDGRKEEEVADPVHDQQQEQNEPEAFWYARCGRQVVDVVAGQGSFSMPPEIVFCPLPSRPRTHPSFLLRR